MKIDTELQSAYFKHIEASRRKEKEEKEIADRIKQLVEREKKRGK